MIGFFFCFKTCAHIIFSQFSVFSLFSPFLTVYDYLFLVFWLNFWFLVPVFFCVGVSVKYVNLLIDVTLFPKSTLIQTGMYFHKFKIKFILTVLIPFHVTGVFLYPLNTLENLFSGGYRKWPVAQNGLSTCPQLIKRTLE